VTAPSPLDRVYLAEILGAGGEELAREVVGTFLTDATRRMEALRDALGTADWPGAAHAAHAIVSGASMLGLTAVSAAARNVEHLAGAQQPPKTEALTALASLIAEAGPMLEQAIAELAPPPGPAG